MTASPARNGYQLYLEALEERLTEGPSSENWSVTRRAIGAHLQEYLRGAVRRVDPEIAAALLVAIEQAEAKEVPELFTPLPRKRGESPNTASAAACIAAAGTYILFCLEHRGKPGVDLAPRSTVARAYGVSDRQASRWKDKGLPGLPLERYAFVRAAMRASAKQYPRFGGASASAIRKRARGDTG